MDLSVEAIQRLPPRGLQRLSAATTSQFRRVVDSIGVESSYNVLDLESGFFHSEVQANARDDERRTFLGELAVGRWDENRDGLYDSPAQRAEQRSIHVGLDLFDCAGTPVKAFADGEVFLTGHYPGKCDYGFIVVLRHVLDGQSVWSLHGHLDPRSLEHKQVGQQVKAGERIGWIGRCHDDVNGGWVPHLHFQLTTVQPTIADWPGVVKSEHRDLARKLYPDPRMVLGQLYQGN